MDVPFAMTWARRVLHSDPPSGHYDSASQRWAPSVLRPVRHLSSGGEDDDNTRLPQSRTDSRAVLIFTRCFDPHADVIIDALDRLGVSCVRINGETLAQDWSVEWQPGSSICRLNMRNGPRREVSIPTDVISAYYRRSSPVEFHPSVRRGAARQFAISESESLLHSLYSYLDPYWVSAPHLVERARVKTPQLAFAQRVGLRIPRTIVTNDPAKARHFAETLQFSVVSKPLHSATLEFGDEVYDLFTTRLTRRDFEAAADTVDLAPVMLQEYLPRVAEIRVTVVGGVVFATEITSSSPDSRTSDRRFDAAAGGAVSYRPVTLPESVSAQVQRLVNLMRLRSASVDLIRTAHGQYFFLELNPNGSWYWLELETGQPIAATMARMLASPRTRSV